MCRLDCERSVLRANPATGETLPGAWAKHASLGAVPSRVTKRVFRVPRKAISRGAVGAKICITRAAALLRDARGTRFGRVNQKGCKRVNACNAQIV